MATADGKKIDLAFGPRGACGRGRGNRLVVRTWMGLLPSVAK
jgi:hypothetical protein